MSSPICAGKEVEPKSLHEWRAMSVASLINEWRQRDRLARERKAAHAKFQRRDGGLRRLRVGLARMRIGPRYDKLTDPG